MRRRCASQKRRIAGARTKSIGRWINHRRAGDSDFRCDVQSTTPRARSRNGDLTERCSVSGVQQIGICDADSRDDMRAALCGRRIESAATNHPDSGIAARGTIDAPDYSTVLRVTADDGRKLLGLRGRYPEGSLGLMLTETFCGAPLSPLDPPPQSTSQSAHSGMPLNVGSAADCQRSHSNHPSLLRRCAAPDGCKWACRMRPSRCRSSLAPADRRTRKIRT